MDAIKERIRRLLGRRGHLLLEVYYFCRYLCGNFGTAHLCPCCGSRLRRFLPDPLASGTVTGFRCPRCDAHPRQRLLWLYLHNTCRQLFDEPLRLLHVAPEFCYQRRFRRMSGLRYVTGDLDAPIADCRFDLMQLPFAAKTFDVLLCNHVLEHVPDDARALRELFRVLKPGGWAILQVPVDQKLAETFEDHSICAPVERARYFGQHDHVRMYGADYPQRLREAGFEVQACDYASRFASHELNYYGLVPTETIYHCSKPGNGLGSKGG